jgi:hypothetical protein
MKLQEEGYYAFIHFYYLWAARWTRLEQSAHTHILKRHNQFTVPTVQEEFFLLCVSRHIGPTSFPLKPTIFKQKKTSAKQTTIPTCSHHSTSYFVSSYISDISLQNAIW